MFDFDPSRMDPETMMELSRLIQQLPPEQISKMQTFMHNMSAGFDVRAQMEEFEKSLPPGFREKIMALAMAPTSSPAAASVSNDVGLDLREARLTILRGVSERQIAPEEALLLLFPS